MFSNIVGTGLTLAKVISGLSKTVNIVKEVIPIYENVKPMLGNTKKILKYFQNGNNLVLKNSNNILNRQIKKTTSTASNLINNPTFFK